MNFAADICEAVGRFHFSVGRKVEFTVGKGEANMDSPTRTRTTHASGVLPYFVEGGCGIIFFFTITISELSAL